MPIVREPELRHLQDAGARPFVAIVLPGLEGLVGQELRALGGGIGHTRGGRGRVAFDGPADAGLRANLWLRCAERILMPVAEGPATHPDLLRRVAGAIPWERWVPPGAAVRLHSSTRACRIYHDGAIADALHDALVSRGLRGLVEDPDAPPTAGTTRGLPPAPRSAGSWLDEDLDAALSDGPEDGADEAVADDPAEATRSPGAEPFWIDVRGTEDRFVFAVDLSGRGLHKRGWRRSPGPAPLRETLAAACVLASGWKATEPLLDPMCGSGTLVIEAALAAIRRAPGLGRSFSMEAMPDFPAARWAELRAGAGGTESPAAPLLQGHDRSRPAVDRARRNAERAGVGHWVRFERHRVGEIEPRDGAGLCLLNPPWGERLPAADLDALRRDLRRVRPGHRILVLGPTSGGRPLLRAQHGGTWVQLMEA